MQMFHMHLKHLTNFW